MPALPKTMDNMTKNLTAQERRVREAAEQAVLPDRGRAASLKMPPLMRQDKAARRYWSAILKRMEGYSILDDLDSDTLGIYCVQLARYDALCEALRRARADLEAAEGSARDLADALARLDSLSGKAQRVEGNLLQYAEKLGLTPSGRARLAQKRAEQAMAAAEPDGDLFGD